MGSGLRAFLVDDKDQLSRLSIDALQGRPGRTHPEYAGKRFRYALVALTCRNRKPLSIDHVDCGYIAFDRKGRLDPAQRQRAMYCAAMCIPGIGMEQESGAVIDASTHFARRRYSHEHSWKPHPKIIRELEAMIFGRNPINIRE